MNQSGWELSKLPAWMEDSSLLVDLSVISIRLKDLQREDLEILGRLPALRILHLEMNHRGRRIIGGFAFGAGSFPSLVHYKLQNIGAVVFQNGAMRRLQMLEFTCPVRETRELAGGFDLGNLLSLQHVHVYVEAQGASKEEVMEAKAALVHATENHPNHPTLEMYGGFVEGAVPTVVIRWLTISLTHLF